MARPLRGMRWRRGKWYGRLPDGRERALSETLETANVIFLKLRQDYQLERHALGDVVGQRRSVSFVLDSYQADLEARVAVGQVSSAHSANVKLCLDWWKASLRAKTVGALTPREVVGLRRRRQLEGASDRTANRYVSALQAALRWAVKEGLVPANPLETVAQIRHEKQVRPRARLSLENAEALVAACRAWDLEHPYHYPQAPLVEIILDTGFRLSEASSLLWRDLFRQGSETLLRVRAENAKTGEARANAIGDYSTEARLTALRALQGRFIGRIAGPLDPIVLTPRGKPWRRRNNQGNALRWLNARLAEAEIPKTGADGRVVDWHSLRHTFCTQCFEAEIPVEQVCRLMGHASIETTWRIYTEWERVSTKGASAKLRELRERSRNPRGGEKDAGGA